MLLPSSNSIRLGVTILIGLVVWLGASLTFRVSAQTERGERKVRARLPEFDRRETKGVFFEDLFEHLVGKRPLANNRREGSPRSDLPDRKRGSADSSDSKAWSRLISVNSLEDEIKLLKLKLDQTVTTPSSFAGRGHRIARRDFTLLAMLFAIIAEYDGDVRWQESALLARNAFARTASNLKAGGSIQVYRESKRRQQDLGDLIRGSRLSGQVPEDSKNMEWPRIVDRSPLMQLLDARFEPNLRKWSGSSENLAEQRDEVIREAELTSAIGAVLAAEGMDDAADAEYQEFARMLQNGGSSLAEAARQEDDAAAQKAATRISRSCVDCHDMYR